MFPNFFIIYTNGETTNSCTFEHSENSSSFTAMLRDLGYQYELYFRQHDRYVLSIRYPAQV